jgi:hypothetical protein
LYVTGVGLITSNLRLGGPSSTAAGNANDPAITVGGYTNAGVYFENSGVGLGAGTNKYLFLDSNGDVDIKNRLGVGGTHSGSYGLYVHGTSYFGNDVVIAGNSSTDSKNLKFYDTGGEEWYVEYNGGLRFVETGSAERLKLLDGGNIDTPDSDTYARFGRARVGYIGHGDYAGFAHRDQSNTTNYALLQGSSGDTFLNSANGQTIYFRTGNSNVGGIVSGNWGLGTISPGSYKLYVNGTSYLGGNCVLNGNLFFSSTSGSFINQDSTTLRLAGDNGVKLQTYSGGWQDRLVIADDGDINIAQRLGVGGAHSDSYQLYVNGTSYFSQRILADDDIDFQTAGDYITFYGDSSRKHAITSRDNDGNPADRDWET